MASEDSDKKKKKKERTDFKNLDVDRSESDYIKNPGAEYERPKAPGKPEVKDFRK